MHGLLLAAGMGLLGASLSLLADLLIARLLPRFGRLPRGRVRTATAAITAVVCFAFALRMEDEPVLPAFVFLGVLGIQLARIDIELHLLPDPLVLLLLAGGAALLTASTLAGEPWSDLVKAVSGGAILFVIYLVLALISPKGIGMGDVKLAAPVGLYLGYLGWTQLLYGGLLGFIVGGIASAVLVGRGPEKTPAEVAYGPSMLAAAIAVVLVSA
ncbi:prepilin peptidase [Arthrobacter sp. S39]|nr:A24 family peptidase [Arthrobacter sp. S39]TAP45887.1 prepilin peptidase [Arthrobacter sp. S39]